MTHKLYWEEHVLGYTALHNEVYLQKNHKSHVETPHQDHLAITIVHIIN